MIRFRRLGRRGVLLVLLALLWAAAAVQVIADPHPHTPGTAILHERVPPSWRVILWGGSALVMLAGAWPNGSLYMRSDGAAGSTLYARIAGAWAAIA